MVGFFRLFRHYPAILTFGVLLTSVSSFGQTFFVALFGNDIRDAFDISHGVYGAIFAGATMASAMLLPLSGRLLDRLSLQVYCLFAGLGLAAACLILGMAQTLGGLALAFLLLRLFGQGVMSNTAMTAISRRFQSDRGKALSLTALGHPLGEAVLPILAIAAVVLVGDWRLVWIGLAVLLAFVVTPAFQGLIRAADRQQAAAETPSAPAGDDGRRHWPLAEVLRDPVFWLFVPAVMMPAFVGTGFIFHQAHLVEIKGWSLAWYASMFTLYALARALGTLAIGPVIDRTGSVVLAVVMPVVQVIGVIALAVSSAQAAGVAFLVASGLSAAAGGVLTASLLAEIYGLRHLGAIRSFMMSVMIVSTALSPPIFGLLIDAGVSMEAIAAVCALAGAPVMAAAAGGAVILRKRDGVT